MNTVDTASVLTLIPARGGSKGIPGKNIRQFLGRPLIAHTIEAARNSRVSGRIVVSTDDAEIARAAKESGAEVPFLRPAEIAADDSPVLSTAMHALDWLEANNGWTPEWLLLLQPTSPLRTPDDIRRAFELLKSNDADAVVAVSAVKSHPYWTKTVGTSGYLCPFIEGQRTPSRRQELSPALALNGMLYLVRVSVLRNEGEFCPTNAIPLLIPASRAFDIDSEQDFLIAEYAASLGSI
jgi:CMP-N,N'-diacetyllegionaminic acid synthase